MNECRIHDTFHFVYQTWHHKIHFYCIFISFIFFARLRQSKCFSLAFGFGFARSACIYVCAYHHRVPANAIKTIKLHARTHIVTSYTYQSHPRQQKRTRVNMKNTHARIDLLYFYYFKWKNTKMTATTAAAAADEKNEVGKKRKNEGKRKRHDMK